MSQIKGYTSNTWKDIGKFGAEAPVCVFNGTKWVELDLTMPPPVDPGTGNPVPVAAFDTLPGLTMFMDAADPSGTGAAVPANKTPVRSWTAKSGAVTFVSPVVDGETVAQTDARAPQFRTATATEPAHLRFSGGSRLSVDAAKVPNAGARTVYVVARLAHLGYGTIFSQGSTTSTQPAFVLDCASDGRTRTFQRTDDGSVAMAYQPLIANAWRVFSMTAADYSTLAFRANEKLAGASASAVSPTGAATMDRMAIGARVSGVTAGAYSSLIKGDVAAVVTYNVAHDATTRAAVESQLATRYKVGIPSLAGLGIDGDPARITANRTELSREYGIPATQRVTGAVLPGFHNTGPAVSVKSTDFEYVEGTFSTTSQNQVVSKKWINGNLLVKHAGVKLVDCVIYSTVDPKVDTRSQPVVTDVNNVDLLRCEIFGKENDQGTGIGYIRYSVNWSFIHDCEDETRLNKSTIIDNNLMGIQSNGFLTDTERLHTDCVQSNGGDNPTGERSYVRNNTLIALRHNLTKGNSAVILATEGANVGGVNQGSPLRHVTVDGNYLAGGSHTLYIKTPGTNGSPGPMEDIVITNNEFRGAKPATGVTMRSGISSDDLTGGAFIPSGNGYADMWLPYTSLADTFLTVSGNIREDGSAVTIDRSTPGGSEAD